MPATTRSSNPCSAGYARAFILRPRRSRLIAAWLISCHAVAAAAIAQLGLGPIGTAGLLAGLALHARWRWPRPVGRIARGADGRWRLEAAGDRGMRLQPATVFGSWWVDLRLCDGSHSCRVLVCRDQLSAEAWRTLIVALRRERVADRLP